MSWIATLSESRRRFLHLAALLILSVVLIWWQQAVTSKVSNVLLNGLYGPFNALSNSVGLLADLEKENQGLRDTLAEVTLHLSMCEEAARENARLREAIGFDPPTGWTHRAAEVIAVNGQEVPVEITINRGANDAIELNQAVVSRHGLIGRVVSLMPDYAQVQLLTHPENRVAVRVVSSGEMGVARYLAGAGLVISHFPSRGEVSVGDEVWSSGLGGIYPPGLKVGKVASVARPENSPNAVVRLELFANLRTLEEVYYLMPAE